MTKPVVSPQSDARLLDIAERAQLSYLSASDDATRKRQGQFFTPRPVARFMASLLPPIPNTFRVLDPGAGAGTLTAAVCERVLDDPLPRQLHFDLFENDAAILPSLETVLSECEASLVAAGHTVEFRVHADDFVLSMGHGVNGLFAPVRTRFDAVISNPPYYKINKDSPYARTMPDIVHGQPNVYSIFMAAAAQLLKRDGVMVAITPRSFCNGLYFRAFRAQFLQQMRLDRVHLFRSRTDTFREAKVLQESVITVSTRSARISPDIVVSRSEGRDVVGVNEQSFLREDIVDAADPDWVVYVPETDEDAEIVRYAKQWERPFEDIGLRISTGPVVMFRSREYLIERDSDEEHVPLLSAHNVNRFSTQWPVDKAKWPTAFRNSAAARKHLVPMQNYVLLKRFSAKEERRRLTAGCLFRDDYATPLIAIENHLNYIYHARRELSKDEVVGVAAVFNSVFFDRYFRTLSGNTQVNATEIRRLHFPSLDTVTRIGARLRKGRTISPTRSEHVVLHELGVDGKLRAYLEMKAA